MLNFRRLQKNGKRYKAWFNSHLLKYYKEEFNKVMDTCGHKPFEFDAQACYDLRCAYLHAGNSETKRAIIDKIDFWIPDSSSKYKDCNIGISSKTGNNERKEYRLNIPLFCKYVCEAAKEFYDSWDDKTDFEKHCITIYHEEN